MRVGEQAARRRKQVAVVVAAALAGVVLGIMCWRYLPGVIAWLLDARAVRTFVNEWGLASRAAMVGINMLQIVVAFLPGEPIELASGYAFKCVGNVPGIRSSSSLGLARSGALL